jgi:hypothetical protein
MPKERKPVPRPSSPERAPRVTDDDDDGLAGALVPKKPRPPVLTGAAAAVLPAGETVTADALAV